MNTLEAYKAVVQTIRVRHKLGSVLRRILAPCQVQKYCASLQVQVSESIVSAEWLDHTFLLSRLRQGRNC